ncbi:hypothetical protein SAMN04488595_10514 [Ralstonia sp. 25mfcol4.1]|uniref:hypothetical protein n=1 Tax=Burkholderiaceae TaxID=119060 RepID=UPI00088B777A|nr:hypothetical protein [Ralstonia sp. 25mfcol4.1]SDP14321.1 hypothetical protein SAMN04488595_10514 [Ralstonia sp. 25mfcol4.1]
MKQHDKSNAGGLDEGTAGADAGGQSRSGGKSRTSRAKSARKPTFAAFLKTIPPGDAYDDQDFARIH